jgi:hypothetical protein
LKNPLNAAKAVSRLLPNGARRFVFDGPRHERLMCVA